MLPGSAGGVGGGGGVERHRSSRPSAHPYLDTISPSTSPAVFPPYTERMHDEADVDAAATAAADRGGSFSEEDRMLLRLLYHQQQSLQVQLNTMMEWMQQVSYRIASVERVVRLSRSTAPPSTAQSPGEASRPSPAQPGSRSASAAESYAPLSSSHLASHPRPTPHSAGAAGTESVAAAAAGSTCAQPSHAGGVHSGQSPQLSSALAVSSVLEGSRACTPPSEQTRHAGGGGGGVGSSAVPSTTRSYESVLAAPWDPHNTSQQSYVGGGGVVHSRTSSHTSALGRRANPLLNSAMGRSKQQLPMAASRSSLMDARSQQQSRLDISGISGTGPTQTSSDTAAAQPVQPRQPPVVSPPAAYTDASVPPYRRVSTETATTLTRQPLSRATAAPRHAPPSSTLTDVAEVRNGREGTLPPPRSEAASSLLKHEDDSHADSRSAQQQQQQQRANASRPRVADVVKPALSPSPPAVHADPVVNGSAPGRGSIRQDAPRRILVDEDSLSDGYGSYESRMYMKNLGLL